MIKGRGSKKLGNRFAHSLYKLENILSLNESLTTVFTFYLEIKKISYMNIAEKMKQDWDQRAEHHARFWIATEDYETEEVFARSGQQTAQALLEVLSDLHKPSWKVLDIGCGIGRILKPLAKHFHTLVGIDVSSTMITQSKVWLSENPQVTTFETSGVDLSEFKDYTFDLVYSYVVFQHMPRPVFEQYLREINRVLSPEGYFAMQLPIGRYCDVPIEDTIGIRSYSIQEIEQKLLANGLAFCHQSEVHRSSNTINQPFDHRFHLIKKIKPLQPMSVQWVQLDHPEHTSPLDMHLYETYADNCVKMGSPQEGIQTLQSLVQRNPEHLSGWLRLTALLLETGKTQQAITTMQALTALHPRYQEGHKALEQLLTKYPKSRGIIAHQGQGQDQDNNLQTFSHLQ